MTTQDLRAILKEIYGIEDKYLVHLNEDTIAPFVDQFDTTGTYVGFDITSKKAYARAYIQGDFIAIPVKVSFRLAFVGREAEKLADEAMFFPERKDVVTAFEKFAAQLDYEPRQSVSYHVHYGGMNDMNSFVCDMACQTTISRNMKHSKWDLNIVEPDSDLWIPTSPSNRGDDGIILKA